MAASRNSYLYQSRLERTGMSHALQIFFIYQGNNAQFNFRCKIGGFYKSKMAASRNSYFFESRLERTGMSHALQIFFVYQGNNAQFNFSVKMADFVNPRWPPAETVISAATVTHKLFSLSLIHISEPTRR